MTTTDLARRLERELLYKSHREQLDEIPDIIERLRQIEARASRVEGLRMSERHVGR